MGHRGVALAAACRQAQGVLGRHAEDVGGERVQAVDPEVGVVVAGVYAAPPVADLALPRKSLSS